MSRLINITRIKAIAGILEALKQDVVFVGGATVSLYADGAGSESRPTDDVDVVIELASYNGYAELDELLRKVGFENEVASGVICRYKVQGIIVDIMPTQPEVIGFSNKWYPEGFLEAVTIQLDEQYVKIFSLPYFIASKLEAFKGRGENDYRFSSDFEDIVYVLENNDDVERQIINAPDTVLQYLKNEFRKLLNDSNLEEGLYAHLEPKTALQQVIKIQNMLERIGNS